jgi:chromate transporter
MSESVSLWSLFTTFLKIGSTAFGGFMALISVVQNEVVERKRLLRQEDMLDGISLATILPGPVAVNVVAYVGYRLRGGAGALVSAAGVILPAFVLVLALSVAYFTWGSVPAVSRIFQGFIPAVAAIIALAAWNMGRKAAKGARAMLILIAAALLLIGIGGFWVTLAIIAGSGVAGWLLFRPSTPEEGARVEGKGVHVSRTAPRSSLLSVHLLPAASLVAPFLSLDVALTAKLFTTFASVSIFLFGGGYVFIPVIQEIVVESHRWLTLQEFVDGIALGQVTPGPILISATFIGYKVAGFAGALAATVGIFLPPVLLMLAGAHALERIKKSVVITAALAGIRPAVVGMIAAAAVTVGWTAPHHWASLLIFAVALVLLTRLRVQVVWVIPAAGLSGLLLF